MTKDRWYSPRLERKTVRCYVAGVAELADALDSKSSDRKIVWVRAPPPALRSSLDVECWTLSVGRLLAEL
jgi:hypothetical protein